MIDIFDARLLNLLQANARRTAESLSRAIGLSPSAVQRRLSRLREQKVIAAEIAVLSPSAVGRRLTMVIDVVVESERPELLQAFKQQLLARPEVMQCYYVTGDRDFVIIATVTDMAHYERFLDEFLLAHPNVKRCSTSVVVDPVKVTLSVPVEAA